MPGTDVLLVGSGYLMADALDAAEELGRHGISVEVVEPCYRKALDGRTDLERGAGQKTGGDKHENHSVINGIGSAVADVLAKHGAGVPLLKLGAQDVFGQVGLVDLLKKEFKLTSADAVQAIEAALA